ncbi:MAG: glycerol-phosphate dehydrogenase [Hyphomicrobiales bacterium]|jgi:glycerol dehydrogenase-like iron-containing ADH family enzyme|nr:glycerol-phosphate dehydrogenase [Hyphomicrobiales bacterium]
MDDLVRKPELILSMLPLRETMQPYNRSGTLIVADTHNYPRLRDLGQSLLVKDQEIEEIGRVRQEFSYERVLAVGGCTALDFGRACAVGKEVINFPTILSHKCLSNGESVIKRSGRYKKEKTIAPLQTIVSLPALLDGPPETVHYWSAAGAGDLLALISAALEYEWLFNDGSFAGVTARGIAQKRPEVFQAFKWLLDDFTAFDVDGLSRLAHYLHELSLEPDDDPDMLSAGSEHWLHYEMVYGQQYSKAATAHGMLVSIGTLMTLRIFGEATRDMTLYECMRRVHQKTGLPLRDEDLKRLGVSRAHIVEGIRTLRSQGLRCLYDEFFAKDDFSLLNRVFGV